MREIVAMPIDKKPFGHMDAGEIIREYNTALEKRKQIDILADLNCCTRKEMARWLDDQGCDVDGRYLGCRKAIEKVLASAEAPEDPQEGPTKTAAPEPKQAPEPQLLTGDQTAKKDAGKAKLSLVPVQIIFDIARICEYGNRKYPEGGSDNWKNVEPERYRDAAFRHFLQYIRDPASVDEESGMPHRWHLECNLAFLAELEEVEGCRH